MRLKAFKAALRKAVVPTSSRWSRSAAAAAQGWKENDGKYSLRANRAPAGAMAEPSYIIGELTGTALLHGRIAIGLEDDVRSAGYVISAFRKALRAACS